MHKDRKITDNFKILASKNAPARALILINSAYMRFSYVFDYS